MTARARTVSLEAIGGREEAPYRNRPRNGRICVTQEPEGWMPVIGPVVTAMLIAVWCIRSASRAVR
jgi:hypothetical protein